jgi:hypothetical protein
MYSSFIGVKIVVKKTNREKNCIFDGLMMNDADARRQTPGLTTPMSAAHLYWCLGVGSSDVIQSAVQFIQYHLSCKLDNG